MTGVARCVNEKRPSVMTVGAAPEGSLHSRGVAKPYKVEGIGEDFIPGTIDLTLIDRIISVNDRDSFLMARRITREEGILVGGSAGTAMEAAGGGAPAPHGENGGGGSPSGTRRRNL